MLSRIIAFLADTAAHVELLNRRNIMLSSHHALSNYRGSCSIVLGIQSDPKGGLVVVRSPLGTSNYPFSLMKKDGLTEKKITSCTSRHICCMPVFYTYLLNIRPSCILCFGMFLLSKPLTPNEDFKKSYLRSPAS